MKAESFDRAFESGEDITSYLDIVSARRPWEDQKRVNVDFPLWVIHKLDREAKRFGIPRQSLIKIIIAQHLERS